MQKQREEERKKRHAKEIEDLRRRQKQQNEERQRQAKAEAAKKAAEEEAARLEKEKADAEALALVTKRIDDEAKTHTRRTKLQAKMAPATVAKARAEISSSGKKAKSDIKKTTTLQKKIRNFASDSVMQIVESIEKLNLTRFRADIANSFFEAPTAGIMQSKDVLPMLLAVYAMHVRHSSFLEDLVGQYAAVFNAGMLFVAASIGCEVSCITIPYLCILGQMRGKLSTLIAGCRYRLAPERRRTTKSTIK